MADMEKFYNDLIIISLYMIIKEIPGTFCFVCTLDILWTFNEHRVMRRMLLETNASSKSYGWFSQTMGNWSFPLALLHIQNYGELSYWS